MQPQASEHRDRDLGYFHPLETHSVNWLASEVRMLHVQRDHETRERRDAETRLKVERDNLRHILAHQAAGTAARRVVGKYRQEGAAQIVELLWPISTCPPDCDGRPDPATTRTETPR